MYIPILKKRFFCVCQIYDIKKNFMATFKDRLQLFQEGETATTRRQFTFNH